HSAFLPECHQQRERRTIMSARMELEHYHDEFLAKTHEVINQPPPLENYNPYTQDQALQEGLRRSDGKWAEAELTEFGEQVGRAENIELGFLANDNKPTLHTHDRFGHRIDLVKFH